MQTIWMGSEGLRNRNGKTGFALIPGFRSNFVQIAAGSKSVRGEFQVRVQGLAPHSFTRGEHARV